MHSDPRLAESPQTPRNNPAVCSRRLAERLRDVNTAPVIRITRPECIEISAVVTATTAYMSRVARGVPTILLTLVACAADPARPRLAHEAADAEVKVVQPDPADHELAAAQRPAAPGEATIVAHPDPTATEDTRDQAAAPPESPPEAAAGPPGPRELSGPALLGARRSRIEAAIGAPRQTDGEWVEYAELALRYRGERCVGLRRKVPAGLSCEAAARWLGYPDASAPLRRDDRCEWPGISLRHRLAPGVAGSLLLAGGLFELRLL